MSLVDFIFPLEGFELDIISRVLEVVSLLASGLESKVDEEGVLDKTVEVEVEAIGRKGGSEASN